MKYFIKKNDQSKYAIFCSDTKERLTEFEFDSVCLNGYNTYHIVGKGNRYAMINNRLVYITPYSISTYTYFKNPNNPLLRDYLHLVIPGVGHKIFNKDGKFICNIDYTKNNFYEKDSLIKIDNREIIYIDLYNRRVSISFRKKSPKPNGLGKLPPNTHLLGKPINVATNSKKKTIKDVTNTSNVNELPIIDLILS